MSIVTNSQVRSHVTRMLGVSGLASLLSLPSTAFAQSATACGPEVKEAIVKTLASVVNASESQQLAVQQDLYKKYQYCAQDATAVGGDFFAAARECGAAVSNLGSLFYEEMSCSGYDPQRRQFA